MLTHRTVPSSRPAARVALMLAAALWLVVPAQAGTVKLTDAGAEAQRRLTLENDLLKVVIDPSRGGQIVSLIYKPSGTEMTRPPADDAMGGLLSDGLWQQSYWHSDWNRAPYSVEILKQDPAVAEVRLTAKGRLWTGLTISKTIRLRADEPVIEADYELSPGKDSDARARPDFWFHQTLGLPGRVYFPSPTGVVEGPTPGQVATSVYEPTRGWAAFVSDKGVGMGATMDFNRLLFFNAEHQGQPTLEWVMRKTAMYPTTPKIVTPVRLTFFTGLDRVDAVGEKAAVAVDFGPPAGGSLPLTLKVAATGRMPSSTVKLEVVKLGQDKATPLTDRQVNANPGQTVSIEVSVPLSGDGTYVVRGVLVGGDMAGTSGGAAGGTSGGDLKFERSIIIGQPGPAYAMANQGPAVPEVEDGPTRARYKPLDLNFNRLGYVTPHYNWTRPYALGKLKVLALFPQGYARTAVEMAQRFDLDMTCPYITNDTYFFLGDAVVSLPLKTVNENVEKAAAGDYDVIVLSNEAWAWMSDKAKKEVMDKLESGTGWLLASSGEGMPEMKDKLPLTFFRSTFRGGYKLADPAASTVLRGLPLDALPPLSVSGTKLRDKAADPKAVSLLEGVAFGDAHGDFHVAAATEVGKGRLVQLTTGLSLLPNMGGSFGDRPPYDYWEYQWQIIGRLLYWAGHKESPVRIDAVDLTREKVTVHLVSADMAGPVTVHVTLRGREGQPLHEADLPATLQSGQAVSVDLAPPAAAQADVFLADVTVSDSRGVLAFGGGALPAEPVRIASLTLDQKIYNAADRAKLLVKLTAPPPAGAKLLASVYDGTGRCVATTEAEAGKQETGVELPLARVLGPMFQARVELVTSKGAADAAGCEGIIRVPRPGNKFMTFFWGGGFGQRTPYLTQLTVGRYVDTGLNANFGNFDWEDEYFDRANMPFRVDAGGMGIGGATPESVAKKPDQPGLSEAMVQTAFTYGVRGGKFGVDRNILIYSLGDEQKGPGKDQDFSKTGLALFRDWLKTQYKSLDELNASWKTEFKTWDEVMPMTEDQIKKFGPEHGAYGAWIDQRDFNCYFYAKIGAAATAGVLSVDKQGRVGGSGTQSADTYASQDWWLESHSYNCLVAYGDLQEQTTYNPGMIRYQWAAYGKPNPFMRGGVWSIMGGNDNGVAMFSDVTILDPDLTLCETGRDMRLALCQINTGAGQLLSDARTPDDHVMLLQSSSSIGLAYIIGQHDLESSSRVGAAALLGPNGLGLGYHPISYEQLDAGHLAESGAKVLFLSCDVAISPEGVQAIGKWVEQGGTLIADLEPGIMSYHGLVMPKGQLDALMGVDRAGATLTKGAWELGPDHGAAASFPAGVVETGIKPAGATALWTAKLKDQAAPAVYQHKVGKGQTYYLAFDAFGARTALGARQHEPGPFASMAMVNRFFLDTMAAAGVRPRATVTLDQAAAPAEGDPVSPFTAVFAKELGAAQIFVIDGGADKASQVRLAQSGYIYDVIAGRLLGRGDRLDLTATGNTIRVLAVLPYLATGMDIGPASLTAKPGQDLTLNAKLLVDGNAKVGPHVFHLDVVRPDGSLDRYLSGDAEATDGQAKFVIPLGLNDPVGAWRLRVHDAATGVAAEAALTVGK